MPIGVYYCARMRARTLFNNIYGVGYGVAVCNERQYQSLCKWNGKIAVPLFYLYIAELQSWKLRFSYMSISFG